MAQNDTQKTLTSKQRAAVAALLTSPDTQSAAVVAGVARKTIYRWMEQPHFVAALDEAEREALKLFARQLVAMSTLAVAAIRDALEDENISVRLRAADIFSQRMLQFRTLVTLEARIAALEAAAAEDTP
jgi:phage terminase small subunit